MSNVRDITAPKMTRSSALWRRLALVLALGLASGSGQPATENAPALEYQVKAAFLVKFAMFVEWPAAAGADAGSPITIGILGEDPFGSYFDQAIKGEQINGHPIQLQRAQRLSKLGNCQIIFIGVSEPKRVKELLRQLADKPVLTVADQPDFAKQGGVMNFIKEESRVRFEVNVAAARRAGIKLSAKLLQVSRIVALDGAGAGGRT